VLPAGQYLLSTVEKSHHLGGNARCIPVAPDYLWDVIVAATLFTGSSPFSRSLSFGSRLHLFI
jgi:hypothetical protein